MEGKCARESCDHEGELFQAPDGEWYCEDCHDAITTWFDEAALRDVESGAALERYYDAKSMYDPPDEWLNRW